MKVTVPQIIEILNNSKTKGAKCAALLTRTTPKMLKFSRVDDTPNPFEEGVAHLALRTVILGANYEAAVNRQRLAENEQAEYFDAQSLWHGKGVRHTAYTVKHSETGRIYFAYKPSQHEANTITGSVADVVQDQWLNVANEQILDFKKDRLQDFLPLPKKSNVQHVNHDVLWRTVALDSVLEVRYGNVYTIQH